MFRNEIYLLRAKWHRISALPQWLKDEGADPRTIELLEMTLDCINRTATPEQWLQIESRHARHH